ncbi:MAG TPA: type II secretion system F family protein, partial [Rhodocyclaceae bacterium]|nr:type II secretion system F family protein [Rhodocyclaceae bacterium]
MRVRLKVIGPDQRPTEIDVDAASEAEAMRTVVGRGLRVLGIETLAGDPARAETGADFPLLLFSQELLALLEAGLTLGEAMVTLHLKEKQPAVKATLGQVREALSEGKNFSDALSHHASAFPEVYVATVRAAERTGNLPTALARFVAYQLQFDAIRRKVVAASIYPVMLMVVGGLVSAFLL